MGCELCDGTGFVIADRDGREYAQPCSCRRGATAEGSADQRLQAARIPPRYEHCSLANFEPGAPSLRAALEKGMSYCNGFPHLGPDEGLGLLLTGDNGVGKTHLAVAVLRELMTRKGIHGQFWDFHELIREIRNSYNPETKTSELMVLEPVVEADVLLLDDLGAWKMTDWMNDTLFYVLNSRYLAKRATIITTNYQDADREKVLAADFLARKEFLVERIGQRLRSRLMEMCVVISMTGPDRRQIARQPANQMVVGGAPGPRGR
jgi:DNA replication protein DnaC